MYQPYREIPIHIIQTQLTLPTTVTGGAGELGFSAARALLEHGASGVCLWDLETTLRARQTALHQLATEFPSARVFAIAVDVTDATAVAEAVQSVVQVCDAATRPLRHLFCFAGIVGCAHALDVTPEQWRGVLEVNTTGAFLCAQAVAKQIVEQREEQQMQHADGAAEASRAPSTGGSSSITLIASMSAHRVNFPQPQAAYNASKAAVVSLKSSLAAEWAVHGIRVNSISPGYMDTILNAGEGNIKQAREIWNSRSPMGRMGAVGELDGMCVLLASRAGSYITGADMVIDGGTAVLY